MLADLEAKAAAGQPFTHDDALRVVACPDLVSIGALGAAARLHAHGARVTYGRVAIIEAGARPAERGDCGEVRVTGVPASADEALRWTREATAFAGGVLVTGFSAADLLTMAGGDHMALAAFAGDLRAAGLSGVAEVPIDRIGADGAEVVRALAHGGLTAARATVSDAGFDARLALIERAASIQAETGAFAAFAPLPRFDPVDVPSTGYDDVKTIALARLMALGIRHVQVDWVLYGPKLAQVAIEYGADDIDAVAPVDYEKLGVRRSPKADIERQIRSAFCEPAERDGRYQIAQ
jgi:aminodeoxyfutalosine synthase